MNIRKYEKTRLPKVISKKDREAQGGKHILLRNPYTHFPLYDTDKNSFIKRYRLWMKYRENSKKPLDVKFFGKVINTFMEKVRKKLIEDPDGIVFRKFKLKLDLVDQMRLKKTSRIAHQKKKKSVYGKFLIIRIVPRHKRVVGSTMDIKRWFFLPNRTIIQRMQEKGVSFDDYKSIYAPKNRNSNFDYYNMFDDF